MKQADAGGEYRPGFGNPSMPCVLVTGAAGFLGSHLCDRLLREGRRVVGLDNFDGYYEPAIKRANIADAMTQTGFTFHEGDIRDGALLESILRTYDVASVIHLAARPGVRPSLENPFLYTDINITGTLRLLEAMKRAGVRRLVFASSSSVYGNDAAVPFREDDRADRPLSPYAATKRAGELLCHTWACLYGFDIWCLRFFTAYGPRQRPEMAIASFLRALLEDREITVYGDSSVARDFTYVDDIIEGIVEAEKHVRSFEVINIGGGHPYTMDELVEVISDVTGVRPKVVRAPIPQGDVTRTQADTTKAERLLGYHPTVPLREGVARQWAWIRDRGGGTLG
ncbi:MAG: GDP-mannose 4,6-dehydratase [Bacteroidota bacterium]|nr:GDP-mannose 4,6-dehydratase [Bacteroidota bacterium]